MPAIPADTREHKWSHRKGWGSFRPNGKKEHVGRRHNPEDWSSDETWAARLFVGFNVGQKERWSLTHLVELVRRLRMAAGRPEDSSFIAQRGVYTHHGGEVVSENGAQVIILNLPALEPKDFEKEMVKLAEGIAGTFQQESVIVEIQKNGISQRTIGVVA